VRSAALVLAALALAALLGPLALPDPTLQSRGSGLLPPSAEHWAGTDALGRDLLARALAGTRISLGIGLAATLVSALLGVLVGAAAGWAGGRADALLMRLVDVLYGLPTVAFVAVLMVVLGRSSWNLFLAIGATSWLTTARIVRAEVRSLRAREFVLAARVLGASDLRIVATHVLPNLLGTVVVYAALTVPLAIRQEALLSFLGLGIEPPRASLGTLIREGLDVLMPGRVEWWLLAVPGAALVLLVFALNEGADALRDRLDPRAARAGGRA
jgi:oligopeptide transport system permease protein